VAAIDAPGSDPIASGAEGCRPRRADARRNRERVLEAAARTFAERGVDAQMDEIAERACVGVGTVYRHFPTKDALMTELVRRKFTAFAAHAREALDVEDPWEALATLLRRNAELMAKDAAVRDALVIGPAAWEAVADARRELVELADQIIRRGQEAGVVRADLTVGDLPPLMCGLGSAMCRPHLGASDWHRHLEIILDGLRARA
jgi:AcrR family transcriptional regulator